MAKKIAIVGSGNAGCISALNLNFLRETEKEEIDIDKIDLYHNPNIPIEKVGQGSQINVRNVLFDTLRMNWYDKNYIDATIKTGVVYQNWGKKNHNFIHDFPSGSIGMHYVPSLLTKAVIESGMFNVIEKNITDPDSEIDADYIIDCRGKLEELDDSYEILTNPVNSVLLAKKPGKDINIIDTICIATPNGWTFKIPNIDSVSYGYLYNNSITTKEEAEKDFIERFDVEPDSNLVFNNYVAKNIWKSERTMLNGNRFSFIEPLEATASGVHLEASEVFFDFLMGDLTQEESNSRMQRHIKENQDFILWHYKNGSRYDTPFWDYAKTLEYSDEKTMKENIESFINVHSYKAIEESKDYVHGQWSAPSFKMWYDNVGGI
jgi:tryptophan halogenase